MTLALLIIGSLISLIAAVRIVLHRLTVNTVTKEAEKIEAEIRRRANLERETVDKTTAKAVEEMKAKNDTDLEQEINR